VHTPARKLSKHTGHTEEKISKRNTFSECLHCGTTLRNTIPMVPGRSPDSRVALNQGGLPSHVVTQWLQNPPQLVYRCGGSTGIVLK